MTPTRKNAQGSPSIVSDQCLHFLNSSPFLFLLFLAWTLPPTAVCHIVFQPLPQHFLFLRVLLSWLLLSHTSVSLALTQTQAPGSGLHASWTPGLLWYQAPSLAEHLSQYCLFLFIPSSPTDGILALMSFFIDAPRTLILLTEEMNGSPSWCKRSPHSEPLKLSNENTSPRAKVSLLEVDPPVSNMQAPLPQLSSFHPLQRSLRSSLNLRVFICKG